METSNPAGMILAMAFLGAFLCIFAWTYSDLFQRRRAVVRRREETDHRGKLVIISIRRYLYGWAMAVRTFRMTRVKDHGAGPAPLYIAWRAAMASRWLVDGQMRGGKPPRYIRRGRS